MRNILTVGLLAATMQLTAQTNISELGHLDFQDLRNSNLSNLWGYADELGNEYALVGVNGSMFGGSQGGVSVVDVTDPGAPQEVAFIPSPSSIWREIKTYGDHAYVTTEAQFGLLIIDLSPLPQSTDLPHTVFQGDGWVTSHSLFIDEQGMLYLNGSNRGNGGVIMYDLTQDPMDPVEVGSYDQWYCHDSYARGDTLYAAHIYNGFFSMVDVSDPASPMLLGTQDTPSEFTHNCWLDDSGDFLFTTDEVSNAYVGAYNVSDPTDIIEVDRLQSDNGSGAVPHNTYWLHHHLVTSYYTYGVTIYDATRPDLLVEVGHYDTSPLTGPGYDGAWGVYPFLPSGNLLVSDIQEGLFILQPTYTRAGFLEGTVTNAANGQPIPNALVTGTGSPLSADLLGHYATGLADAGSFAVNVSATGFISATVPDVTVEQGVTTTIDVALWPVGTGIEDDGALHSTPSVRSIDGAVRVEWTQAGGGQASLLDVAGRVVATHRLDERGRTSFEGVPSAVYLVRCTTPDGRPATVRTVMP